MGKKRYSKPEITKMTAEEAQEKTSTLDPEHFSVSMLYEPKKEWAPQEVPLDQTQPTKNAQGLFMLPISSVAGLNNTFRFTIPDDIVLVRVVAVGGEPEDGETTIEQINSSRCGDILTSPLSNDVLADINLRFLKGEVTTLSLRKSTATLIQAVVVLFRLT